MDPFRILSVEDDVEWYEMFRDNLMKVEPSALCGRGHNGLEFVHVTNQEDAEEAVREARPKGFHLVLLDLRYPETAEEFEAHKDDEDYMPPCLGMPWLPEIRRQLPEAVIVIITHYAYENDLEDAVHAIRDHHANDYLPKDTEFEHVVPRLALAYNKMYDMKKLIMLEEEYRNLLRSHAARVYAEDGAALLDHIKGPFSRIAQDIESGDSTAIKAAPEQIRATFKTLQQDFLKLVEVLFAYRAPCRETDVAEIARQMVLLYERDFWDAGAYVEGPPNSQKVTLHTYTSDLKVALHEVFANALVALQEAQKTRSDEGRFSVEVLPQGETVTVRVTDNGNGFPDDVINSLFVPRKRQRQGRSTPGNWPLCGQAYDVRDRRGHRREEQARRRGSCRVNSERLGYK